GEPEIYSSSAIVNILIITIIFIVTILVISTTIDNSLIDNGFNVQLPSTNVEFALITCLIYPKPDRIPIISYLFLSTITGRKFIHRNDCIKLQHSSKILHRHGI